MGLRRFIRYLYEYEQEKRMRNVGFVKVEKDEEQCMLHVHGKGFFEGDAGKLTVYLFFVQGGGLECIPLGTVECTGAALNEMWRYEKREESFGEYFDRIDGVLLENEQGRRFGAVWDDTVVDVSKMKILSKQEKKADFMQEETSPSEKEAELAEETAAELAEEAAVELAEEKETELAEEAAVEKREMNRPDADREYRAAENTVVENTGREDRTAENTDRENAVVENTAREDKVAENTGRESKNKESPTRVYTGEKVEIPAIRSEDYTGMHLSQTVTKKKAFRVRKIQRMELSKLARCEWNLANNRFLMHGYYNYHHLVFLESDDAFLLGVPGIYHEKEAQAAESFGFARFIALDELEIDLSSEEQNEEEKFGYWCRPVRRNFRWE